MKLHRLALLGLAGLALTGCGDIRTEQQKSYDEASMNASERKAYVAKNSLDFNNYDRRQKISDNPSTIVWCTAVFSQPGAPMITVPIVGKLTSGGKRPFNSEMGPDGMYGSSGDYRYGFTPGGNMVDFSGIATFCTTEPTVWQREKTTIVVATDPGLSAATKTAQSHLAASTNNKSTKADAVIGSALQAEQ